MSKVITEQVVVVGAGPAGLSTVKKLVEVGARVLLIDRGERPGGQYWRHTADSKISNKHEELRMITHPDVEYLPRSNVWNATYRDGVSTLHLIVDGKWQRQVNARNLILATGAYDRSLPFPGWDLPGVMTAGGVQALMKGQKTIAGKEIVIAGTGPLLLPLAVGLIMAGVHVKAIVEASRPTAWLTRLRALAHNDGKLKDFFIFRKIIVGAKVKMYFGKAVVVAHGTDSVEGVVVANISRRFKIIPGRKIKMSCDVLAVGWGFTPDISVGTALGCAIRVEPCDGSLIIVVDDEQATSLPGVYAAGEITGIGGSALALTEGQIAALAVAEAIGLIESANLASQTKDLRGTRRKQKIFADALLAVYRVADGWTTWQESETILCRCEEVSVADLQGAISELGVSDLRSAGLLTRAGMGMCQGGICSQAVATFVAKKCARDLTSLDRQNKAKWDVLTPLSLGLLSREEKT